MCSSSLAPATVPIASSARHNDGDIPSRYVHIVNYLKSHVKINIADRFTSLEDVLDNDVVSVDDDGVIFVCLPRSETWLVISLTAKTQRLTTRHIVFLSGRRPKSSTAVTRTRTCTCGGTSDHVPSTGENPRRTYWVRCVCSERAKW